MIDYSIVGKRFGRLTVIDLYHVGETHSVVEWSRILGINHETLRYRVNNGNMRDFEKYFRKEI